MAEDLKKETAKGVIWSSIEKFGTQGINFLVNIILARLLLPADFGLIAMCTVFLQISQTIIDCGFSNALIQRKDRNETDFSTVFWFNLGLSFLLYGILFVAAPWISDFYHAPELTGILRLLCVILILGAIGSVHQTRLYINLQFKRLAIVSSVSSVVSGGVAIWMAYAGRGVWSLVWMSLIKIFLISVLLIFAARWWPKKPFSMPAFRRLFSYSSRLLGANLIHQIFYNLYTIVIGKFYSQRQLGYFNRAELFARFPSQTLSLVVGRVAFPVLSRMQDDNERLARAYSKYITYSSALIFPVMAAVVGLAEPLVIFLLTDKWLPIVPLLRILSLAWVTDHLCNINLNMLYVKGRTDLALRIEILKKGVATLFLILTMKHGLAAICWGFAAYSLFSIAATAYYSRPLIGLSIWRQMRDYLPIFLLASIAGGGAWLLTMVVPGAGWQLLTGLLVGAAAYLLMIRFFERPIWEEAVSLLRRRN
ncbi:MAG: lipopolysaccharide biosynthesis protein [Muribaculaceae bacterium]|nr:lipopolysaccharide biosynthesis protein [Muribaculaceae bacterium]